MPASACSLSPIILFGVLVLLLGCGKTIAGNPASSHLSTAPTDAKSMKIQQDQQIYGKITEEQSKALLLSSFPYTLDGRKVQGFNDVTLCPKLMKSEDKDVAALASIGLLIDAMIQKAANNEQDYIRSIEGLLGVGSKGSPTPQSLADFSKGFEHNYAQALEKSNGRYSNQLILLAAQYERWHRAAESFKRWVGSGSFQTADCEVKAQYDKGYRILVTNRSTHDLHHIVILVDVKRRKQTPGNRDLDRALGVAAAELAGKESQRDKERLSRGFVNNVIAYEMLKETPIRTLVYIPVLAAGKHADYIFMTNTVGMNQIEAVSYSLLGGTTPVENQPLPEFEALKEELAKQQAARQPKAPDKLQEPGSSVLFTTGSIWQSGTVQLKVKSRTGNEFTGQLLMGGRLLRNLVGTIIEGNITWEGARGESRPGVKNVGTINDKTIEMRYPLGSDQSKLDGYLKLEYVNKK